MKRALPYIGLLIAAVIVIAAIFILTDRSEEKNPENLVDSPIVGPVGIASPGNQPNESEKPKLNELGDPENLDGGDISYGADVEWKTADYYMDVVDAIGFGIMPPIEANDLLFSYSDAESLKIASVYFTYGDYDYLVRACKGDVDAKQVSAITGSWELVKEGIDYKLYSVESMINVVSLKVNGMTVCVTSSTAPENTVLRTAGEIKNRNAN